MIMSCCDLCYRKYLNEDGTVDAEAYKQLVEQGIVVVHRCPPGDESLTPCCHKTPFDLPSWHRITTEAKYVTCNNDAFEPHDSLCDCVCHTKGSNIFH